MLNNIGEACTACRACEQICPNSAIIFEKDEYGNIYPQVLEDKCTWCGLCNSVCHVQNTVSLHTITKYYAGFSNDEDRKNSASGGICAAIYQMGLKEGYKLFPLISARNYMLFCSIGRIPERNCLCLFACTLLNLPHMIQKILMRCNSMTHELNQEQFFRI